jgi:hypothetical protein
MWLHHKKNKEKKRIAEENKLLIAQWEKNGRPSPPPQLYKRLVIKKYADQYGIKVFLETGTYLGETLDYCRSIFSKLISIELDVKLFEKAKIKFADEKKITLYQGDSGEVIEKVLTDITEPCLFWLDGHYSEGFTAKGDLNTPIVNELNHIFEHGIDDHVILIDDARCFVGKDDYPSLESLEAFIKSKKPDLKFSVNDDIIRLHK